MKSLKIFEEPTLTGYGAFIKEEIKGLQYADGIGSFYDSLVLSHEALRGQRDIAVRLLQTLAQTEVTGLMTKAKLNKWRNTAKALASQALQDIEDYSDPA